MARTLIPATEIAGTLAVPGDKSIAHRAILASLLATGPLDVAGIPDNADCRASLDAVLALGVRAEESEAGLRLAPPARPKAAEGVVIDCRNSGTTARLLAGIVAGSELDVTLTGDASLRGRPMRRVAEPLRLMGAAIDGEADRLPLRIRGRRLHALDYRLPVPSAQVKSSLLLAALASSCGVVVREPWRTRDHSERLVAALGDGLTVTEDGVPVDPTADAVAAESGAASPGAERVLRLAPGAAIGPGVVDVPGDPSTAAFFFAAAAISGGTVTVTGMGLNPTRTAFLEHLVRSGCRVDIANRRVVSGEPRGDVTVVGGPLAATSIDGEQAVRLVDEIPIAAVLASFARGETRIRGAGELRVKESDRIAAVAENLRRMGVAHVEHPDGLDIAGGSAGRAADFAAFGDHRIAMAFSVAALFLDGPSRIDDDAIVAVSCAPFYELLGRIAR